MIVCDPSCTYEMVQTKMESFKLCKLRAPKTIYNHIITYIYTHTYCRASHTGDAGRGRGRERERGMSSELANMTC